MPTSPSIIITTRGIWRFSAGGRKPTPRTNAQELDPLTPVHTPHFGTLYLYQDRYDDGPIEAQKAVEFARKAPGPMGEHVNPLIDSC